MIADASHIREMPVQAGGLNQMCVSHAECVIVESCRKRKGLIKSEAFLNTGFVLIIL